MPSLGLPIYGQHDGRRPDPATPERWRSLAEAEGRAAAEAGQYPDGDEAAPATFGRRGFVQLLSASAALAGLAGCKPPREKVVGYVKRPEGVTPSLPGYYATALSQGGHAVGVVVETHEGRPTKIEGHRDHPASLGGSGLAEQAAILELYQPDRLSGVRRRGGRMAWSALLPELSALARTHEADGGARLRLLCEPTSSPALAALRQKLLARFPRARIDTWDAIGDEAAREGARLAFGRPLEADQDLTTADVILALDADPLGGEGEHLRHARAFAARREGAPMNRLYVAEPGYSVTGGAADHRFRMRGAEVLAFARGVAGALASRHGLAALAPLGAPLATERARQAEVVAKDLVRARGRGLVLAGRRQPPALHALVALMNEALGHVGRTLVWREPALVDPATGPAGLARLAQELAAGQVATLVITAWNPAYTAPADLGLAGLLGKAPELIYLAAQEDETSGLAGTVIAAAHPLEAWGDLRARNGLASVVQPLIAPLRESVTELDLTAAFVEQGHLGAWRHVRDAWQAQAGQAGFDRAWESWLSAGLLHATELRAVQVEASAAGVAAAVAAAGAPPAGLEVLFAADEKVLDGRLAGNAWLQELPHPISKLTWGNAALVSPATARRLGLEDGDVVKLTLRGRSVEAAAMVQPGHADEAITLPLGYGRRVVGPAGQGAGFDATALRTAAAPWIDGGLGLVKTGKRQELARTQEHFSMEGRDIALEYPLEALPHAAHKLEELRGDQATILPAVDYSKEQYRWGMAIDLTKCTGCGICTLACQAENNIPVVGKEQVLLSREMHWLRVDRYYQGPPEEPTSISQPLACVHCESAPCEYVCPVNATVHSDEGLNEMVYNRCVGTRYCSNNCPYKVRRFNYLDFHPTAPPTLAMLANPDVTVRARGVMEKCTYCVQRIERARIGVRALGAPGDTIGGDAVVSACQQACPAEAIVFGNLNDPSSRVARAHRDDRRYDLLHQLGTRPRTAYLVRVKNPNPELA